MANSSDDIMIRLLADIDDKYDKTVGSFFYDAQKSVAIESEALYGRIDEISSKAYVMTASGTDLDYKLAELGLSRIPAAYAIGCVTFEGEEGTEIANGTQVCSDTLTFTINEEGVIDDGKTTLSCVCNTSGTVGNVPARSINRMGVTINGITAVYNIDPLNGGSDEETDESARERFLLNARRPSTSGNKYDYENWARAASVDVGGVRCIPLWDNNSSHAPGEVPGHVTVLLTDSENTPASSDLIKIVSEYIEDKRPIGANVTVASVEAFPVTFTIQKLESQSGYSQEEIFQNISVVLQNFFKNDIKFGENQILSYAHLNSLILSAEGVSDFEGLTINSSTSNIIVPNNSIAVLGGLFINE